MNKMYALKKVVILIFLLMLGGACGFFYARKNSVESDLAGNGPRRISGKYKYVSPLIACNFSENKEYREYMPLEKAFQDIVQSGITDHKIETASVYFRDLSSGRWVGLNPDQTYWPASLLKVPMLLASLNYIEEHPEFLKSAVKLVGTEDKNAGEFFSSAHHTVLGKNYTVEELLKYMSSYSDNNALIAVASLIDHKNIDDVYTEASITIPKNQSNFPAFISVKQYSYFFRMFYNAAYINQIFSDYALSLLAQSDFKQGIVAGVPPEIEVAHKFGEQSLGPDQKSEKYLHDCGIVYFPNKAYLLCVMTKGTDYIDMASIILVPNF